ncbi:hypothetical protein Nepgr_010901 [Nepenthes gracilis]|uniref:Uncharacterized protein n=1 Tax=Nepenthes gracilis TaxID=150966 RepID=A0AAD3XLV1_NEPGR|nr:hypothetical protein Nepgr_010901 [Nepenthes gracilis]
MFVNTGKKNSDGNRGCSIHGSPTLSLTVHGLREAPVMAYAKRCGISSAVKKVLVEFLKLYTVRKQLGRSCVTTKTIMPCVVAMQRGSSSALLHSRLFFITQRNNNDIYGDDPIIDLPCTVHR